MACNSCAKPFTLFRKEKGCPGCGFSYCNKCLDNKVLLKKFASEVKVCFKCKKTSGTEGKNIVTPPDAYYKRLEAMTSNESNSKSVPDATNDTEEEIRKRLQKLKESKEKDKGTTNDEIMERLQNIKGPQPTTSDAELKRRLADLKGVPNIEVPSKPILSMPDTRTEQEQADDLLKQYLDQANIHTKYQEGFSKQIDEIEARMLKLRGASTPNDPKSSATHEEGESEDEDTIIKKIIQKVKAESALQVDEDIPPATSDELPFCEICNEDATLRCLGCRYLFCKPCFLEHKDDEDGCDRYEPYKPSKNL